MKLDTVVRALTKCAAEFGTYLYVHRNISDSVAVKRAVDRRQRQVLKFGKRAEVYLQIANAKTTNKKFKKMPSRHELFWRAKLEPFDVSNKLKSVKLCDHCGAVIKSNSKKCEYCGKDDEK